MKQLFPIFAVGGLLAALSFWAGGLSVEEFHKQAEPAKPSSRGAAVSVVNDDMSITLVPIADASPSSSFWTASTAGDLWEMIDDDPTSIDGNFVSCSSGVGNAPLNFELPTASEVYSTAKIIINGDTKELSDSYLEDATIVDLVDNETIFSLSFSMTRYLDGLAEFEMSLVSDPRIIGQPELRLNFIQGGTGFDQIEVQAVRVETNYVSELPEPEADITLEDITVSAEASSTISANSAIALAGITVSSTASSVIVADSAITLAPVTVKSNNFPPIQADAAITLAPITVTSDNRLRVLSMEFDAQPRYKSALSVSPGKTLVFRTSADE